MAIRLYGQLVMITFMVSMLLSLGGCTGDEHLGDTGSISGIVATESGQAIEGALIRVSDSELRTITDVNGEFTLNLPEGNIELSAASETYLSTSVRVDVLRGRYVKISEIMTMARESNNYNEPVKMRLRTSSDVFSTSECVMVTMEITNNSMESIIASNWFIEVTDDKGQPVYRTRIKSPAYTIGPQQIVGKTEKWEWYNGENLLPVILGNNLTVTALATVEPLSGKENSLYNLPPQLISPPARIQLTNRNLIIQPIPYTEIGQGTGQISIQNGGCLISNSNELETFLKINDETLKTNSETLSANNETGPFSNIDFNSDILLGVAGSRKQNQPYVISIDELKIVAPYRWDSSLATSEETKTPTAIENANVSGTAICIVTGSSIPFSEIMETTPSTNTQSSWQIIRISRKALGTADVEFIWREN
jgi:hypothetical protein